MLEGAGGLCPEPAGVQTLALRLGNGAAGPWGIWAAGPVVIRSQCLGGMGPQGLGEMDLAAGSGEDWASGPGGGSGPQGQAMGGAGPQGLRGTGLPRHLAQLPPCPWPPCSPAACPPQRGPRSSCAAAFTDEETGSWGSEQALCPALCPLGPGRASWQGTRSLGV